ncbi:MAG: hypothetical protein HOC63_11755 [Rhodospirillales bacterium]|nr:hypothetical protein [Rhodospirillales bacterium]
MDDPIVEFVVNFLVAGGGGAAIAYLIFKTLGGNWIESKFAKELEEFKHKQAIEIQNLKIEIDATLNGVIKIQDKEFEVLPEAWRLLHEAVNEIKSLLSFMQMTADLDHMGFDRLEEFLAGTPLLDTQKESIRQTEQKTLKYSEEIFWHELNRVKKTCLNLSEYVAGNGIFFPPTIKEDFNSIVKALHTALVDKEIGKQMNDFKIEHESWIRIRDEIVPLYNSIEKDVHTRLQWHGVR